MPLEVILKVFRVASSIGNPTTLETSIGYADATAVTVIDEVAFVNERQDKRMEGIEEC